MGYDRDIMNQGGGNLPIAPGADVYDINGDKVGTVQQYNQAANCLVVEKGKIFTKDVYIPTSAIQSSDANGVRISLTKDELKEDRYSSPPTGTVTMNRDWDNRDVDLNS